LQNEAATCDGRRRLDGDNRAPTIRRSFSMQSIGIRHAAALYPCHSPNEQPLVDAWLRIDGSAITALGVEPCPEELARADLAEPSR
jgi:hypothetical protein